MAERRFSHIDGFDAARRVMRVFDHRVPLSGWVVRDAAVPVFQPFYAALDAERRLCWTDDYGLAERFATKQAAERFAADRATSDVCVVKCN